MTSPAFRMGNCVAFDTIATGGMGTVYLGRLEGASGFSRIVVLKRLHTFVPGAASVLRDEAWLTARIRHRNVVTMLDVVEQDGELALVMDYVEGCSLAELLSARRPLPPPIAAAIVLDVLAGLGAAHAARAEDGTPLDLVHRDVSPQNVLIGVDGITRLTDFGLAKARGRLVQTTTQGELKGKFAYMAPEQIAGRSVTARADLYAAAAVLFECLTGRRLHEGNDPGEVLTSILYEALPDVRALRPELTVEIQALFVKALAKAPDERFGDAAAFASEVERVLGRASPTEVHTLMEEALGATLRERAAARRTIEQDAHARTPRDRGVADEAARAQLQDREGMAAPPAVRPVTRRLLPVVIAAVAIAALGAFALATRETRQQVRASPTAAPPPPPAALVTEATATPAPSDVHPVEPPKTTANVTASARAGGRPQRPTTAPPTADASPPTVGAPAPSRAPLTGIPLDRDPTGP